MKNYGIFKILLLLVVAMSLLSGCKEKPEENEEERRERIIKDYFELIESDLKGVVSTEGYTQKGGQRITLEEARRLHCNWENRVRLRYKDHEDSIKAVFFYKDSIISFMDSSNIKGLRLYFVLRLDTIKGKYERDVLLVPVDAEDNDLYPITNLPDRRPSNEQLRERSIMNGSGPCPERCNLPNGSACP